MGNSRKDSPQDQSPTPRSSREAFQTSDHRWHLVCRSLRGWVAYDASRSASLEDPAITTFASGPNKEFGKIFIIICVILPGSKLEKKASTAAIIDSQSVRTTSHPGDRGYDAGKKITGRKRHVLVDTLGFILLLKVTSADVQDREGARLLLLEKLKTTFGWLRVIWADGGYTGKLIGEIASIVRHFKVKLEIVKRSDDVKGFKILPKRWIVERTFGRLIQSRSLV